jgi:hypothetical protein
MAVVSRTSFDPTLSLSQRRINVDPATRRIAVRIASWNDAHSGIPGAVRMPKNVNLDAAHVGRALLDDGTDLEVANLPMGTLHAKQGLTAAQAAQMYENTGTSIARVRYSTDEEGIRADGVLFDDVDEATMDRLIASAPSGDWRSLSLVRRMQDFEHAPSDFAGACLVNLPGYSSKFSQSPATPMRLVASANSMILLEGADMQTDEVTTDEGEVETPAPVTEETTPAACDPAEPACEGCTCGRADETPVDETPADEAPAELMALRASVAENLEQIDALLAAAAPAMAMDHAAPDHAAMMQMMNDRITSLEDDVEILKEVVAQAILSS